MANRGKRTVVVVVGLIALVLGWKLTHKSEPEYKGQPFSNWVLEIHYEAFDDPALQPTKSEIRDVVLTIGTNNLPLLAHWISYEHEKSISVRIFRVMPDWLAQLRIFESLIKKEDRKPDLAQCAVDAFEIIGGKGAPAIPDLKQILRTGSSISSSRA